MATYFVDETTAGFAGSLDTLILQANANPGLDTIDFSFLAPGAIFDFDIPDITDSLILSSAGGAVDFRLGASRELVTWAGLTLVNGSAVHGTVRIEDGGSLAGTDDLLISRLVFARGNTSTLSAQLVGTSSIQVLQGDTVVLGPAQVATYTGTTTVHGTLVLGAFPTGSLPAASPVVLGATGTLDLTQADFFHPFESITGEGQILLGPLAGLVFSPQTDLTSNVDIAGEGILVIDTAARVTLTGALTLQPGATIRIDRGTLVAGPGASLPVDVRFIGSPGSVLEIRTPDWINSIEGVGTVLLDADVVIERSSSQGIGQTTGAGRLIKRSNVDLVVQTASHTGGTTIEAGTLQVFGGLSGNVDGAGRLVIDAASSWVYSGVITGVDMTINPNGNALTLAGGQHAAGDIWMPGLGRVTLAGAAGSTYGAVDILNAGGLLDVGVSASVASLGGSGAVALSGSGVTLTVNQSNGFNGIVSGDGTLRVAGAGSFTFVDSQQFGSLVVTGLSTAAATVNVLLQTALNVELGSAFTAYSGAGVRGTLSGSGTIESAGLTMELNLSSDSTFTGNFIGTGDVVKRGAGQLTLPGSFGFAGRFIAAEGALVVDGSIAAEAVVQGGGSLMGTGSIQATLAGGWLRPGVGIGTITLLDLNASAGASVDLELGATHDSINAIGSVTLAGATLNLVQLPGLAPVVGSELVLIDNDGIDAIAGTFQHAEGALLTLGGQTFRLSYMGGTGNDLTLTVLGAPPPPPPAVFSVINTNPSGPGSLSQAIADANASASADTIDIDPALGSPNFGPGLPPIEGDVRIVRGGAAPAFSMMVGWAVSRCAAVC